MKYIGQFLFYAAFASLVGLLSIWPSYHILGPQDALVSVTFSHAGKRIGECRTLTQEELNKLAPNMRKPKECPRERHPIYVELRADDQLIFAQTLLPSGLWNDGKSNIYQRTKVDAGEYLIFVGMNDTGANDSFDYELSRNLTIRPGSNVVIRFDDLHAKFVIE
jgi:hypothetical protein